jgi:hypothetical protein
MSKLESLAKMFKFKAWNYVENGNTALYFREPLAIRVTKNNDNYTYTVELYYTLFKIVLTLDENDNVVNQDVIDIQDLLTALNDIYGELYNLSR